MKREHTYMGVRYETQNVGEIYHVLLAGLPVTGTTSQSRGEASMRFMLMLEAMQDFESKPMMVGDLIQYNGESVGMIDCVDALMYPEGTTLDDIIKGEPATIQAIHIRESLGGDTTNFRGPNCAMSTDQTPRCSLSGGPFTTRPKLTYEWQGVAEVEFWAWRELPAAQGGFRYTREVNIWREVANAIN